MLKADWTPGSCGTRWLWSRLVAERDGYQRLLEHAADGDDRYVSLSRPKALVVAISRSWSSVDMATAQPMAQPPMVAAPDWAALDRLHDVHVPKRQLDHLRMLHHYGHPKFAAAMEEYLRMNSIGSLFSVEDRMHVPNWVSAVDHDMQLDPQLFDSLERLIRTHGHAGQAEANRLI